MRYYFVHIVTQNKYCYCLGCQIIVNEWRLQQWQDMEKISISEKMAAGKGATLKGEVKPEKQFGAIGKLQDVGFIDINLGPILKLAVLSEGNTLSVTLLGLKISVALNKATEPGQSDLAIITIGDSVIELPCTQNGIDKDKIPNVKINLIKGNRTDIDSCTVSGISSGYDVYAGGADDTTDGSNNSGYSGGFIGLNHEGQVKNSTMTLCDVVRGTKNLVGPFTGVNDLKSVYSFNTIKSIEGNNNHYSIYRAYNALLAKVAKANKDVFGSAEKDTSTGTDYNRYEVLHLDKITEFSDLKDAKMEDAAAATTADLAAYASPAKAVLMLDTANTDNPDSTITEPADTADPCKKYVDALADNAKLRPAVGRNIRINPAHLCQNVLLFIVALHGIVDVGDTPHLTVHFAGAPSAVRIDFINRDGLLHRSRDFVAAPRSACGGIFI